MNPKNIEKYLEKLLCYERKYYETYDNGAYKPITDDVVVKCYPQSFGRVNVVISSHYAYTSGVVTRYNQLNTLYNEFMNRSFYYFYQKFYFKNRK